MNDDYLWNKTGKPDPEVQELEEVLGVLRYKPRPIVLPANLARPRRLRLSALLAVAACVALAFLAAGLWFAATSSKSSKPEQAKQRQLNNPSPSPNVDNQNVAKDQTAGTNQETQPKANNKPQQQSQPVVAYHRHRDNAAVIAKRNREREEALEVKQQLLMALRVASEKLNQAQRKAQNPAPPNQIRNQHKVS
ncbi:MAG: hypothetical protein C5B55_12145 [Blastocatellia bacterium]|nr:MAG: hypothetical protein C5B55_12145 [Blastocatellia bacterium]